MHDTDDEEIQSILRMLLYMRAELARNGLEEQAVHLDACLESIVDRVRQGTAPNVIEFSPRRRGNTPE